jgi:hypothetical protein
MRRRQEKTDMMVSHFIIGLAEGAENRARKKNERERAG